MIGIILLISQQIIAGTNACEFVSTYAGVTTPKYNSLRIKNGESVTIDFSGGPDIQSVEGSSIIKAQITSAGFVEIKIRQVQAHLKKNTESISM